MSPGRIVLVALLAAGAGSAWAAPQDLYPYPYPGDPGQGSGSSGGDSGQLQSYIEDGAPPASINLRRLLARQQVGALWRRFSSQRLALSGAGVLGARAVPVAGESHTAQGWSLWMDGAYIHMRDTTAAGRSRGRSLGGTLGLDRLLMPGTTLGLSLNHSDTRVRTFYNSGKEHTRNTFVGLYLSHQFTDWLSLDVQGGYVYQLQKLQRKNLAGLFSGRRHSHGYLFSGSLNAWKWLSRHVMLSARAGIIASRDKWHRYTEYGPLGAVPRPPRTERLVQGVLEGGVSLWLDPVMTYARVSWNHDIQRKGVASSTDRDDFTLTGGLSIFGTGQAEGLAMDFSGNAILGRRGQRHWSLMMNVKWAW